MISARKYLALGGWTCSVFGALYSYVLVWNLLYGQVKPRQYYFEQLIEPNLAGPVMLLLGASLFLAARRHP